MSNSDSSPTIASVFLSSLAPAMKNHSNIFNASEETYMPTMMAQGFDAPAPKLSIIAMKGHPFTRKTEFANIIASSLGCPVFSSENVLLPYLGTLLSPELEYYAFQVTTKIAFHHLQVGISKNIVIDSPLSSASHLKLLTQLASLLRLQVRIIIIECKPVNAYSWQLKLKKRFAIRPPTSDEWHKAKNWEDVEKAIKDNPDYDETSVEGHELVSKLVIDPLVDHPVDEFNAILNKFHVKPLTTPRIAEAVKYMLTRDKKSNQEGPDVVVYSQWLQQSQYHSSSTPMGETQAWDCSRQGHYIVPSSMMVEGIHHEGTTVCRACKRQVMRSHAAGVYCYCKNCSLTLHMECAEAFDPGNKTRQSSFPINSASTFNKNTVSLKYCFPEEFACNPCKEICKDFSENCATCLFETHLKCRLLPTVIKHFDTEEHFLTIELLPNQLVDMEVYRCVACGYDARCNIYLCKICGVAYHYGCLTFPRRLEDEHGGHHHHLSLKFKSEEAEDYLCQECQEYRDPALWFYSCEECPGYELHPFCVDIVRKSELAVEDRRDIDEMLAKLLGVKV